MEASLSWPLLKSRGRQNHRFPRASVQREQDGAGYLHQRESYLLLALSEHFIWAVKERQALILQCPGEIGLDVS